MKSFKYFFTIVILITSFDLTAQVDRDNDSTIAFKVFGNCEMCKERIEKAAKGKGVIKVNWDIDTKLLTLSVNGSVFNPDKIHHRIAEAGHDTEKEKASDNTYNELPECCHYRKKELIENSQHAVNGIMTGEQSGKIKGVVLEEDKKGSFRPLPGASVIWLGTNKGTFTDSSGIFFIQHDDNPSRLVISYTGYTADTITITDMKELKIILASGKQLSEVKVYAKQRSTYLAALSPIRTQVMTEKELFKAACCNLSESFETNPSVDVSYNDAVTGSKQIQLLGLSGNYTQLTVENLPGPRGIATPLGLSSIAGSWVESIQLNKGVGSVANGFESIAGQINIELKKPEKAERFYENMYINSMGKTDFNLNLTQKIGKKWSTGLLLHDDLLYNKTIDVNKDGFLDLPIGNLFSALNRWKRSFILHGRQETGARREPPWVTLA